MILTSNYTYEIYHEEIIMGVNIVLTRRAAYNSENDYLDFKDLVKQTTVFLHNVDIKNGAIEES